MSNKFNKKDYPEILEKSNGLCGECESWQIEPTPHHLISRSAGGSSDPSNGIFLCPKCHFKAHHQKGGKELRDRLCEKYLTDLEKSWQGKIVPKIII